MDKICIILTPVTKRFCKQDDTRFSGILLSCLNCNNASSKQWHFPFLPFLTDRPYMNVLAVTLDEKFLLSTTALLNCLRLSDCKYSIQCKVRMSFNNMNCQSCGRKSNFWKERGETARGWESTGREHVQPHAKISENWQDNFCKGPKLPVFPSPALIFPNGKKYALCSKNWNLDVIFSGLSSIIWRCNRCLSIFRLLLTTNENGVNPLWLRIYYYNLILTELLNSCHKTP